MIGIITIINTNTIHHNTQRREMTHRRIQLQQRAPVKRTQQQLVEHRQPLTHV